MNKLFFRPQEKNSAAADFIPFYANGKFRLFYLFDHRNPEKYGNEIAWHLIETEDFLHFENHGEVVRAGKEDELDLKVFTGCVLQANGIYHMFYTGHNDNNRTEEKNCECIMHATSTDLKTWTKLYEDTFWAPEGYDRHDFRDPFVYFDQEKQIYNMLLCARELNTNKIRSGATIRMSSADLKKWTFDRNIYAPNSYQTHECPDLFQWGDWWYLIFSEYSDKNLTHYRMSKTPNGPWLKPVDDVFDGRAYYAAKTASNGTDRYLFGWVPTRMDNKDNGIWMWGGNLVVHKLIQNPDGTLAVTVPDQIIQAFGEENHLSDNSLRLFSKYSTKVADIADLKGVEQYKLTFKARPHLGGSRFGVLVKRNKEEDTAYSFCFDLEECKIEINRFPCFPQYAMHTYMLQRPLPSSYDYDVTLICDDDVYTLYVNNNLALSVRLCELKGDSLSLFTDNCDVDFDNIALNFLK